MFTVGKPCEVLVQEIYTKVEIVKPGRDPNTTYSHGVVVKMTCHQGYGVNIGENGTARCARGKWKPDKPHCRICEYSNIICFFYALADLIYHHET